MRDKLKHVTELDVKWLFKHSDTIKEVASRLGVSKQGLHYWLKKNGKYVGLELRDIKERENGQKVLRVIGKESKAWGDRQG